jgi:hypothetical protein
LFFLSSQNPQIQLCKRFLFYSTPMPGAGENAPVSANPGSRILEALISLFSSL